MQKVMNNSVILAMALMVTFTLASVQTEAKNKPEDSLKSKTESPVEFKYIGKMNNQPLFQLNFNNVESSDFIITLTDQTGAVIYDEKISGKDLSRKYMLNLDEIDASEVKFLIKNKTNNSATNFTVKRNYSLVDVWALK
ncbi:MAG: hypothetical protein ABJA57_12210 [Ginsengibacter sp.]